MVNKQQEDISKKQQQLPTYHYTKQQENMHFFPG